MKLMMAKTKQNKKQEECLLVKLISQYSIECKFVNDNSKLTIPIHSQIPEFVMNRMFSIETDWSLCYSDTEYTRVNLLFIAVEML